MINLGDKVIVDPQSDLFTHMEAQNQSEMINSEVASDPGVQLDLRQNTQILATSNP